MPATRSPIRSRSSEVAARPRPGSALEDRGSPVQPARSTAGEVSEAFAAGCVVAGRFRIERRIGEGGAAEVFAVRDADERELAVKVLHTHLARNEVVRERFRREMELSRRLAGPGIVQIYGMHEHGGRPFFTMEL